MQLNRLLVAASAAAALHLLFPAVGSALDLEDQQVSYMFRNFTDTDRVHVVSHFGRYNASLSPGNRFQDPVEPRDGDRPRGPGRRRNPGSG